MLPTIIFFQTANFMNEWLMLLWKVVYAIQNPHGVADGVTIVASPVLLLAADTVKATVDVA